MGVTVSPGDVFSASPPRVVHEGRFFRTINGNTSFGLTPDGNRFLRIQRVEPERAMTRIDLVLNWFSELKQGPRRRQVRRSPESIMAATARTNASAVLDWQSLEARYDGIWLPPHSPSCGKSSPATGLAPSGVSRPDRGDESDPRPQLHGNGNSRGPQARRMAQPAGRRFLFHPPLGTPGGRDRLELREVWSPLKRWLC
jgi:hypothetical protein